MGEHDSIGLDPDWVAPQVVVEGRRPNGAEFAGFIGTGQMSRNARFRLDWGGAGTGAEPPSVVVKVPSSHDNTRALSFQYPIYSRECDFYRSIHSMVDVIAPMSHAVHFDQEGQDFAIVLEDLAESEQGDQFSEVTDDQLVLAIQQAAALQGPVWGRTTGPAFGAFSSSVEERATITQETMPFFLPAVYERLAAGVDPDVLELIDWFATSAGAWTRLAAVPTTLVHGDFRPDNFMFGRSPSAPGLAIVDWQTLSLGRGVTDVSYLLGAAVTPERRRRIEHDMLARYCEELQRYEVDYRIDRCVDEYAIGSLHGVLTAIRATLTAARTERGDELFTLMLNRHGRHALDVGAVDRVEQSR